MEYPIKVPPGCPSYIASSVQNQCNGALARAVGALTSATHLEQEAKRALSDECEMLRRATDKLLAGDAVASPESWWLSWGYRTVTGAKENAARLAHFREALARSDFSHVTSGHPVSPHTYHVYVRVDASPSGCHLASSAGHDLPGVEAVLAASGRSTTAGAQRGRRRVG